MNYNSVPFKIQAGYEIKRTDVEILKSLCIFLRKKALDARSNLAESKNGVIKDNRDIDEILSLSTTGYDKLGKNYDFLDGYIVPPKKAILSDLMSYEQISGIFPIVYTESIVNANAPIYSIPHTACHELSHQLGFMQEDEANFIGFLACIYNEDPLYVYSGYYSAFTSAMNQLYKYDRNAWTEILSQTDVGIYNDMVNENNFWKSYQKKAPFIAELSENINNKYLQANNIKDGTHSYGRMVDLLISHYKELL
jgi:hypothetical protein